MDSEEISLRAQKRERALWTGFEAFSDSWSMPQRADCSMNRGLLLHAMNAYFADIARLKEFHQIEYEDSHKRAGYTVKWLMRFRPIQYHNSHVDTRQKILLNECFALWIACEFLGISMTEVPDALVQNITYNFRFRTIEPDTWAVVFYLLQAKFKGT